MTYNLERDEYHSHRFIRCTVDSIYQQPTNPTITRWKRQIMLHIQELHLGTIRKESFSSKNFKLLDHWRNRSALSTHILLLNNGFRRMKLYFYMY